MNTILYARSLLASVFLLTLLLNSAAQAQFIDKETRSKKREEEIKTSSETFSWWPSDAKPAPVRDERGGFWWWPVEPGEVTELWGNRGYIYVMKIIYDYMAEEEDEEIPAPVTEATPVQVAPAPAPVPELKPSLIIRKMIRNVKIYFDYNKADLRDDHIPILNKAVKTLERNKEASILITGNCDTRGSDEYNLKLGEKRGSSVEDFMLDHGITEDRIKIVSRGKLDAVAPVNDLVGMQKDRNAQFMIAEVQEVMMGTGKAPDTTQDNIKKIDDNKYLIEEKETVESAVEVSTRDYVIQKNDSLWTIAERELGKGTRWKYLYELNKDVIKDPNRLKAGTTIAIPVE